MKLNKGILNVLICTDVCITAQLFKWKKKGFTQLYADYERKSHSQSLHCLRVNLNGLK